LRLRIGRYTQALLQRLTQVGIPAQCGGTVATRQFALHQSAVRCLVFRIDLRQPLPLAAGAQQLQLALTQTLTDRFSPGFESGTGQQVAHIEGCSVGAVGRVTLRQGSIGTLFEGQRIYHDRALRPKQHLTAMQHYGIVAPQCLARVVSGLSQVGGTRLGFELRPKRIDYLVARQSLTWLQAQQLHQLRGAQTGPAFAAQFNTVNGDGKAAEQESVKAD
jgi:hypothetical protein